MLRNLHHDFGNCSQPDLHPTELYIFHHAGSFQEMALDALQEESIVEECLMTIISETKMQMLKHAMSAEINVLTDW